jgi:uncharacterized membrane protein
MKNIQKTNNTEKPFDSSENVKNFRRKQGDELYEKLDKCFEVINSSLNDSSNDEPDEQANIDKSLSRILARVSQLKRRRFIRRILRLLAVLLLLIGICILTWDTIRIHIIFAARLLAVLCVS